MTSLIKVAFLGYKWRRELKEVQVERCATAIALKALRNLLGRNGDGM